MASPPKYVIPNHCAVCSSPRLGLFCRVGDRDFPGKTWKVWSCSRCGYGWTQPRVTREEIALYYTTDYLGDTRRTLQQFLDGQLKRSRSWRRETEKVALVERYAAGGRVLDVGCAGAAFLLAMDSKRWHRVGVEFVQEVVEIVRQEFPQMEVFAGDIESDRLGENSFDAITFWHVFEHLFESRKILKRVFQLLRPGGSAFLSVPNFASYQADLFRHHWYAFDLPRHLHHFSPRSLEILLADSGLKVLEHVFFSKMSNFHQLKHSLVHWSEERFASRIPYYLLKPTLFLFSSFERFSVRYGSLTTIATKP